jgi:hypothetical protein
MSSTYFETEGSSLERRVYKQVWYSVFYMHQYKIVKHTIPFLYLLAVFLKMNPQVQTL